MFRELRVKGGATFLGVGVMTGLPEIAFAGTALPEPTVTFGPAAASIPTLGGWMLILLSLFLAFVGFMILRRQDANGGRMAATLAVGFVGGAVVAAGGGVGLIADADATTFPTTKNWQVGNPQGDVFPVQGGDINVFENSSAVAMVVTEVSEAVESVCPTPFQTNITACEEGTTVPTGESCEINCAARLEER